MGGISVGEVKFKVGDRVKLIPCQRAKLAEAEYGQEAVVVGIDKIASGYINIHWLCETGRGDGNYFTDRFAVVEEVQSMVLKPMRVWCGMRVKRL